MAPSQSWRENRLAHPEDEVLICLYLPWNLYSHGDVIPRNRRWLMANFSEILTVFEKASVPVHMSYQQVDIDSLVVLHGFDPERLQNLPMLSAPFGHPLLGLMENLAPDHAHLRFQIQNGAQGNLTATLDGVEHAFYFCPEFDVPSTLKKVFGERRMIFPNVGKFAVSYSHCKVGGEEDDLLIEEFDAIRYQGSLVVPMKAADGGGDKFMGAWFGYQKDDSDENLRKVVDVIRSIVENEKNRGKSVVLFIDGESMLVGGNPLFEGEYPLRGYELWEKFFKALAEEGLARYFGDMEQAAERWNEQASTLPDGQLISRKYNKWTGEARQIKTVSAYESILPGEKMTKAKHFVANHISTSDNLSVHTTANKPRAHRYKFMGRGQEWQLDYDHMVVTLGAISWKTLQENKMSFPRQIERTTSAGFSPFSRDGKVMGEDERWQLSLAAALYHYYTEEI
jgi:hypothetical protein